MLGAATFVVSNLIGLGKPRRSACSAIPLLARWDLFTLLALLASFGRHERWLFLWSLADCLPITCLAKVGLFWLAGYVGKENIEDWSILAAEPGTLFLSGTLSRDFRSSAIPRVLGEVAVVMPWRPAKAMCGSRSSLLGSLLESAYHVSLAWPSSAPGRRDGTASGVDSRILLPVAAMRLVALGQRLWRC